MSKRPGTVKRFMKTCESTTNVVGAGGPRNFIGTVFMKRGPFAANLPLRSKPLQRKSPKRADAVRSSCSWAVMQHFLRYITLGGDKILDVM